MRRTRSALLAVLLLVTAFGHGPFRADTYDTHTLVEVSAPCPEDAELLYRVGADIVGRRGDLYKALLTAEQMELLREEGIPFAVLEEEMARDREAFASPGRCPQPGGAPCYYTASRFDTVAPPEGSLMEHLLQLHLAHPDITRLYDIGDSQDGSYDILAMQVSLNPDLIEPEPKLRIYGNIHGDEVGGLMVATGVLDWLLASYPADAQARALVEGADLWFVPMGNPWGNARASRYNSRGKDLNRNFSGPNGCDAPPCFSEAETQAVRDLTEVLGKRFTLSVSFHGGAICFNSVYNYTSAPTTDEPIFFSSRDGGPYGDAVPSPDGLAEAYQRGCTTPSFWYTNGADWYITRGDTNDWSYSVWADLDTTLEVSEVKWPDPSFIPTLQGQHRQATVNYLLKAFQGISGVVRDAGTSSPLEATVTVTATASPTIPVPHAYREVFADPTAGDYHRILQPGTYTVTCSSPGYLPRTVEGVAVEADATTTVDFALGRPGLAAEASADSLTGTAPLTVHFTSAISGGTPPYDILWVFGDGSTSAEPAPEHTFGTPGLYSVALAATDAAGSTATDDHIRIAVAEAPCSVTCSASAPVDPVAGEPAYFGASAQVEGCASGPSYLWDFGDGTSSIQKNPRHTYASPGVYTWALTVTAGEAACTRTGTLQVLPPCSVTCSASAAPSEGPAPLAVSFQAEATADHCAGSLTYAWDFGDGSASSEPSPTHAYELPGTYAWSLTVSADGETCSATGSVTAVAPCTLACSASASAPDPGDPLRISFQAIAESEGCEGEPAYLWDFGDGASGVGPSTEHRYGTAGAYAWSLTVAQGGRECTRQGTVSVSEPCTLACEAWAVPPSGQAPLEVAFSSQVSSSACSEPVSVLWEFGDGTSSIEASPIYTYASPGTYAWGFTATSGSVTCSRTGTLTVAEPTCTVSCEASATSGGGGSPLGASFEASATADHCVGEATFAWDFGDGGTGEGPSARHTYPSPGTYAWTLEVLLGEVRCLRTGTVLIAPGLPGDCSGDGEVSIGEIQRVVNMYLGLEPPGCGADCDGDGQISIGELQRSVNAFLGLTQHC